MNISPPGENGNLSYHTSFYYLFTWVGTIPWGRARQPTPVSLPGVSHGQRSLAGCSPWGRTESDTTEVTQQQQQHWYIKIYTVYIISVCIYVCVCVCVCASVCVYIWISFPWNLCNIQTNYTSLNNFLENKWEKVKEIWKGKFWWKKHSINTLVCVCSGLQRLLDVWNSCKIYGSWTL